jgi:hypothetical protein
LPGGRWQYSVSKGQDRILKKGFAARDSHLHAALGHLAHGRNRQIILVIDNADQREFDTQQQAFLVAQELASTRNLLVFVALRPSTFYVSKTTGELSGYQNRLLTIPPPPADEAMSRRIAFAVRVAGGKVAPAALEGIRLYLKSIVLFLRINCDQPELVLLIVCEIADVRRWRLKHFVCKLFRDVHFVQI